MSVVINQVEPNVYNVCTVVRIEEIEPQLYSVNGKKIYTDGERGVSLFKFTDAEINALSNYINSKNSSDE